MHTTLTGPSLPLQTCARRLAPFGVTAHRVEGVEAAASETLSLEWTSVVAPPGPATEAQVSWFGPAKLETDRPGSEAVVQALCGLMAANGRDQGRPRRIGIEIASVAAGVLTGHALLADMIGRSRGLPPAPVETSVLQAGLLLMSHYLAAATCDSEWMPASAGPEPGPPFQTSDGHWFEIETFDPEAWKRFWVDLGAHGVDLGKGWTLFRSRYYRGTCTLPPGFHQLTSSHTLRQVTALAEAHQISLVRVRGHAEVLFAPARSEGHPVLEPLNGSIAHGVAPTGGGGATPTDPADHLPLAGLHVVEATNRMQGPLAGLLLRMMGAKVTRVEPPGGDVGRMVPPLAGDVGSFFLCFNRGKEPLELDLSSAGGQAELRELTSEADVFLHNLRPGKAAEWGLDAGTLAAGNPRLVHVEASGWGDQSENRHLIGTDFLVQAHAGLGESVTPEGEPPSPSRVLLTDFMGALITCEGALGGLYLREQTGRGCQVGTSLLAGAMALQAHVFDALAAGREQGRWGGRPVWGPLDRPIQTTEGTLVVTGGDRATFARLCSACGADPDTGTRREVEHEIGCRIRAGTAVEWEETLVAAGVPVAVAVVNDDLGALPGDARFADLFEPLAGTCRAPASPWTFNGATPP